MSRVNNAIQQVSPGYFLFEVLTIFFLNYSFETTPFIIILIFNNIIYTKI